MKTKRFEATPEMIGQYVNRHLYTDVYPVGKIVGIKSKTVLLIQPLETELLNPEELKFEVGGFSAHCSNQRSQKYSFTEKGEQFELKMCGGNRQLQIFERPLYFYDYNF